MESLIRIGHALRIGPYRRRALMHWSNKYRLSRTTEISLWPAASSVKVLCRSSTMAKPTRVKVEYGDTLRALLLT
jgi:hypothetical protein